MLAEVFKTHTSKEGKVRDVTLRYKVNNDSLSYKGQADSFIERSVHSLVIILPNEERNMNGNKVSQKVGEC